MRTLAGVLRALGRELVVRKEKLSPLCVEAELSAWEAIKAASAGEWGLDSEINEALAKLKDPLHLQVFVTPT